ncbi:hypothetical protein JAAARDRAFT_29537 [Jaapia argillacea MUCL 33604]|uniref:Pentacotripeptide-repeat region of PRORP domain-containing protein n=1 Tax=Jaapia argillacea MUCL 33604 TaxID=933084 RepID=A0A067QBI7_9AGAM|nr:hypothetical protein JAAARDRAFT_29537 [Jaapia argillacea MUCL 33604]
MLLRHAGAKAHILLLDFLAPSLLARRAASSVARPTTRRPPRTSPVSTHPAAVTSADIPALIQSLKRKSAESDHIEAFNATIASLRGALRAGDISSARKEWVNLETRGFLGLLGPSQSENFSREVAYLVAKERVSAWSDEDLAAIENIALVSAAGRAWDGLQACMLARIRKNDPDGALALYSSYLERSDQAEVMAKDSDVGKEEDEENVYGGNHPLISELPGGSESHPARYIPGRGPLVLAAIAAHASKDSFQGALHLTLTTSFKFVAFLIQELLKRLDDDSLRVKVEEYIRRLRVAKLLSQPPTFHKHVSNLANESAVAQLEDLYQSVLDGFSGPYSWLAATPEAVCPQRPVLMVPMAWGCFISGFLSCQQRALADKVWTELGERGVPPSVAIWTSLIEGYSHINAPQEALVAWKNMLAQQIKPDTKAFLAIISTLFTCRRPDEAIEKFRQFEKAKPQLESTEGNPASLIVYNAVLHGFLINDREADARALLDRLKQTGPHPDIVTYNSLLRFYGRKGSLKALAASLQSLVSDGLVGDVFTFSTILSALLKAGREDATTMVTNLMLKHGLEPNVATYTSILDQQIREEDIKSFRAAFDLLRWMETQSPLIQPNDVTYTCVLAGMYRHNWLDPKVREDCRKWIVQRMESRKIAPNRVTYHILLKGCLENPSPDGVNEAMKYYDEMRRRRFYFASDTWWVLLGGLVRRRDWKLAMQIVEDIKKSGFVPRGGLLNLILIIQTNAPRT